MIPPSCHSNSYSPISREWREDELVVPPDLKNVCPVKFDNLAVNYHRGKWLAWKDTRKMTPTKDEVHLDKGRSVFWMFKNGEGCPTITTSFYTKVIDGVPIRKYYISGLTDGEFSASFILRNGTREEDVGRVVRYNEDLTNSSHVLFIEPECHRLMLAQNVRLEKPDPMNPSKPRGVLIDKADVKWFTPVIHYDKLNFLEHNPRMGTDVRPYIIPDASEGGWPLDEKPYGVQFTRTVPNNPRGAPNDRVDWRYNPRWLTSFHGNIDDYEAGADSDPQRGTNEELWDVYQYDPVTGEIIGVNPTPRTEGGLDMLESCSLVNFACNRTRDPEYDDVALSDLKYYMQLTEHGRPVLDENGFPRYGQYHYIDPNGNEGWTPDWGEWDEWDSTDDLIMLYGMKSTKFYRQFTKDIEEEKEDEQGHKTTETRHVPVWVYDHTEWVPIYWEPIAGSETNPPPPWGEQMMRKLRDCEVAYGRTQEEMDNGWKNWLLHTMEDMTNLIGDETVFDLRLYCVRYNWKAKPLVPDLKWNEEKQEWERQYEKFARYKENGEPELDGNGEQAYDLRLKVKVSDDPTETKRGYFNTLCRADVRRIVKARPVDP